MEEFLAKGTTSAYAENTASPRMMCTISRNYLRVRGEYKAGGSREQWREELPPRTRRILGTGELFRVAHGTTSAYAENTSLMVSSRAVRGNYLRVRGEY